MYRHMIEIFYRYGDYQEFSSGRQLLIVANMRRSPQSKPLVMRNKVLVVAIQIVVRTKRF